MYNNYKPRIMHPSNYPPHTSVYQVARKEDITVASNFTHKKQATPAHVSNTTEEKQAVLRKVFGRIASGENSTCLALK